MTGLLKMSPSTPSSLPTHFFLVLLSIMATATSSIQAAANQTIAILSLSGTTITATAVPETTGLAVVDGTTISFRAEGITLSDGQVFSLGFDGLVDSSTTGMYTAVAVSHPTTPYASDASEEARGSGGSGEENDAPKKDLRKRQQVENPNTSHNSAIQVTNPPTSSVPELTSTNVYSSTAITGENSPSPSSYTDVEGTIGTAETEVSSRTGEANATLTMLTGSLETQAPTLTRTSEVTGHVSPTSTETSTTTLSVATLSGTETGLATSTAGQEGGAAGIQSLGLGGWAVAGLGLVVALGGIVGL